MDIKNEDKIISDYIKTHLGSKGDKEVKIFTNAEVPVLYHVSNNSNIPYFYPKVSNKLFKGETQSIPRTSTSPTLIQCLNGYGPIWKENAVGGWNLADKKWNGLYSVYLPEYELAFKPSEKLVGDIKWSDEYWLLYFKPEQYKRKASQVATFFLKSVKETFKKDTVEIDLELVLRITTSEFHVAPDVILPKGCYLITMLNVKSPRYEPVLNENLFIEEMTEKDFNWQWAMRSVSKPPSK